MYFVIAVNGNIMAGVSAAIIAFLILPSVSLKYLMTTKV
jgi:hypothetical protein